MKTEKFSGEVSQAYGKQLPNPVKFDGEFDAYENYDEIATANDLPSHDEIVTIVNAKRKASARAKATTAALDLAGYAKPSADDPAVIQANQIKLIQKQFGLDEATATKVYESMQQTAAALKA